MLTPPRYLTMPSHTRNPSDVKCDMNAQNYMTTHLTKKLDHKWLGSFVIKKVISPAAVKLCLSPCKQGIHPVISVSNICPYHPDPILECTLYPLYMANRYNPGANLLHTHYQEGLTCSREASPYPHLADLIA